MGYRHHGGWRHHGGGYDHSHGEPPEEHGRHPHRYSEDGFFGTLGKWLKWGVGLVTEFAKIATGWLHTTATAIDNTVDGWGNKGGHADSRGNRGQRGGDGKITPLPPEDDYTALVPSGQESGGIVPLESAEAPIASVSPSSVPDARSTSQSPSITPLPKA